ncbi:MAG: hypothetical protein CVU69_07740 [Deltaproteobacteria bacterium HGW-Deltaproteobacteria-4]|nr:MAG: hypothetical protein CVU69_07740 [Deltaproteobacteria bacterium HGW-Deltaproteobacteria-4]
MALTTVKIRPNACIASALRKSESESGVLAVHFLAKGDTIMNKRTEYVEKLSAQMVEWDVQIERLHRFHSFA